MAAAIGSTAIGLAGVALNEILKSQGITSKGQTAVLDPFGFIVEGIIELATAQKKPTAEDYVREQFTPEYLDYLYYLNLQKKYEKEEARLVKLAKMAYTARKNEMASSKRAEATSNIRVAPTKLIKQEVTKPQVVTLPTRVDYESKILSRQAHNREMSDDAIAAAQKLASERLQLESQRNSLNQKRSIMTAETSAIKNLANLQQVQVNELQKQKEEAEQAVIQNEIQQRLKNLSAPPISTGKVLPPSVPISTGKVLPPSVSVRGRGNKLLIKVMNDFGMTKLEARRYIKKHGID